MPAGCSSTPLARKLGIRPGHRLLLVGAPADFEIPGLPGEVDLERRARGKRLAEPASGHVVVAFFRRLADLRHDAAGLSRTIVPDGSLWIAWPRRAAGHESDITDNAVRDCTLPLGLVDVKVAALGDDWSGLKTVWRRELRPALTAARA
ncbi:MAG TPA: DUF3052 domain-containing protein [Acidimicrobiales bacterium]|nr:DUF3052 domain-containing protein [Acidimicrobiales bacterium]